MNRWAELVGAMTLLTRLPVGGWSAAHPPPSACVWAYPIVGAVVGGGGAAVMAGVMALGLPQPIAACWALAAMALLTGALHEDGLADTADGFGGGRTVDRKLAIMRDSRIGSFGALALAFSVLVRFAALAGSGRPLVAIVLAGVLGRGAMLIPLLLLRPARTDGLAAALGGTVRTPALTGLALTALVAAAAPGAALAALVSGLGVTFLAHQHVRGHTGDVLGATEQGAECAALSVLAA